MQADKQQHEIACQQVLLEDSSVFSVQWSIFPADIGEQLSVSLLLERYCAYIRSSTLSLIRPRQMASGVEFRLVGTGLSLISFLPPVFENGALVLRICGGMLVQPRQCHRGELRFGVEPVPAGVKVSLQLSEYCPLLLGSATPSPWREWLYRGTQAAIHRLVTVRFLARLYRHYRGAGACVKVVPVQVRDGRPV